MKNLEKLTLLSLAFLLFCTFESCNQKIQTLPNKIPGPELTTVKPEEAGMSAERLARIDTLMQQYISKKWIPGGVVIIARHGKIVYHQNWGMNDAENRQLIQKENLFRIASMTKAITSVAVMMLYEEGKFLLDDPVSRYIPEFKNPQVMDTFNARDTTYTTRPARSEITIRHLLTHTSGISYGFTNPQMNAVYKKAGVQDGIITEPVKVGEKMKILAGLPLLHNPGEKWTYGLSTDVLGYFVEVISGMSLADFFRKRIFDPLEMSDTYFYIPQEKAGRLATLYSENKEGVVVKTPINAGAGANFPLAGARAYFSGGAGLSSTALDYAKFLQMMLNGGYYNGARLLSRKTVALMTMNQIGELYQDKNKFGLGFSITTEKGKARSLASEGKYGWGGIFNTNYWIDPEEDILVVVMTQVLPTSHKELFDMVETLTYQSLSD